MARQNNLVVQGARSALDLMKMEVASELGLAVSQSTSFDTEFAGELGSTNGHSKQRPYMGYYTSRETGSIGGEMTRRLVANGESSEI